MQTRFDMARKDLPTFENWEAEKLKDAEELEPSYQAAHLRMLRGLTQAQLAEMVGTR
jgi:hypothetical protein